MFNILAQSVQTETTVSAGFALTYFLLVIIAAVITIVGMWKMFEKAGKPGWAAIIPIYNVVILLEVARRPLWWILLLFIPFVNIVASLLVALDIGRKFGQSDTFSVILLWLFSAFGYVILGFGDAEYTASTE